MSYIRSQECTFCHPEITQTRQAAGYRPLTNEPEGFEGTVKLDGFLTSAGGDNRESGKHAAEQKNGQPPRALS